MKYHELTQDDIDKKIMSFQNNVKYQNGVGHNLYYICTVDQDDNICEERYGMNLMTNIGFWMHYCNDGSSRKNDFNYRFLVGTGYIDDTYPTNSTLTGAPALTDQSMEECATISTQFTSNPEIVLTSYSDLGVQNNGVLYCVKRIGNGYLDYTTSLFTGNTAAHCGGEPEAAERDTRWKYDSEEDTDYFYISEIGACPTSNTDGTICSYFQYTSGSSSSNWYLYKDNYYSDNDHTRPENNQPGKTDITRWCVYWHFLTLDYDGTFHPIKKKNTQKLIIHIYHTMILPESMILGDYLNTSDKQRLLISPEWLFKFPSSMYVLALSGNKTLYPGWSNNLGPNNTIADRLKAYEDTRYLSKITQFYNGTGQYAIVQTKTGNPLLNSETPFGTVSGVSSQYDHTTGSRIIEDPYLFVSHFLVSENIRAVQSSTYGDATTASVLMYIYPHLSESDEITQEVVANGVSDLKINNTFSTSTSNNYYIIRTRQGVLPIMEMSGTIPQYGYYLNTDSDDYDIPVQLSIPQYFNAEEYITEALLLKNFECPGNVLKDVFVYMNPFAKHKSGTDDTNYDGPYPGKTISSFNQTDGTMYAADKYWDISTWTQFQDTNNVVDAEDSGGHLLVHKKYFIRIFNTYNDSTVIRLSPTFIDADYPKIVPSTETKDLFKYESGYGYSLHDRMQRVGSDTQKWFTLSKSTIVKLTGATGTGVGNTLAISNLYRPATEHLRMHCQNHVANGKILAYRLDNSCWFNISDVTDPSSILPYQNFDYGNDTITNSSTTYEETVDTSKVKTLKHHFALPRYCSCTENTKWDDDNERFVVVSDDAVVDNDDTIHPHTITIFDSNVDPSVDTTTYEYSETAYAMGTDFKYANPNADDTSVGTSSKKCMMEDGHYIAVNYDDIIFPIFGVQFGNNYSAANGSKSYNDGGYWGGAMYHYDTDTGTYTKLSTIGRRRDPKIINDPDCTHVRVFSYQNNGSHDPTTSGIDRTGGIGYDDPNLEIRVIKCHNYGVDVPYIENAKYGTCIRASREYTLTTGGSAKYFMAYNDCSDGTTPYQTWNIIDMNDVYDANDDVNVLATFNIDESYIGSGENVITDTIGFSHYLYIRMKAPNGLYNIWVYDIATDTLNQMLDTNGFLTYEHTHECCFVATKDVLCFTSQKVNSSLISNNGSCGSWIYAIKETDPLTIQYLFGCENNSSLPEYQYYDAYSLGYNNWAKILYQSFTNLQLKYVDRGANAHQLVLCADGVTNGSTIFATQIVLDVGQWLHDNGSWKMGAPPTQWWKNNRTYSAPSSTSAYVSFGYLYDKGLICLKDLDRTFASSLKSTYIEYHPLEYLLPFQFTCSTNTINAYNNPIKMEGLQVRFNITNNLKSISNNLDYNGTNIDQNNRT